MKYNVISSRNIAFLVLSASIAGAHAETDVEEGHVITVYGDGYRSTGTKSDLKPIDAPMSYEVYDAELLQQRQVDSVNEALRYIPGLTPESRGATVTIFDQYTIRGFESYRNYYDGLILQYNNLWNLAPQVDAYATESIEVLKGPTSVLYGTAPPGGMVNQVAKHPLSEESTDLRLRLGTNELAELGVDHNGVLGDNVDYRVVALGRSRDGQMETTEEERFLFAPSVTLKLSDKTSLNLNLYYQDDPESIPSTPLPSKQVIGLDSDAFAGDENWNNVDREVTMLGYKFNHQISDNLTFLQNFRYTDGELLQRNTYHVNPPGAVLTRYAYRTDEEIEGFTIDNQLALTIDVGATEHKLLFGIDYQKLDSDIVYRDTFSVGTPTINLLNPDHNQFDVATIESNFVYTQTEDIEQEQLGFYIQDEMKWDAITLIANLRRDRYESTNNANYGGALATIESDQDETTGRLAAMYTLDNGWRPYISYATSYEPTPGLDSNTGTALEPTTAEQYEVGLKFSSDDGNTQFTAAYFDITQEDVVTYASFPANYTQTGEVSSEGIELSLRTRVFEDFDIQASASHLDVEVTEDDDASLIGKTPINVAEKQASLWGTYYINNAFNMSLGVRYIGESQIDAQNTDTVPSYTLFDAAVSYQLSDDYRLAFSVTNISDRNYISSCFDANNCWAGAERSAEVTLHASF